MRKKALLILIFASLVTFKVLIMDSPLFRPNRGSKPIRIALQGPWVTLDPSLQHTLWGDLALSNQFDPLVGTFPEGGIAPLGAESWKISDDHRVFKFRINPSKRYSDGTPLRAQDYKTSWIRSLRIEPKSANSSLLDVLYRVKGFDPKATDPLPGMRVLDDHHLEIEFKEPFRMALDHLTGIRFSAYRETPQGFLGSGNYVLTAKDAEHVDLQPNPFAEGTKDLSPIELSVLPAGRTLKAFENDEVDVMAYGAADAFEPSVYKNDRLTILAGQEAAQFTLGLNGSDPKRPFAQKKLRQAVQYITLRYLRQHPDLLGDSRYSKIDPQIYLPLQPGRLSEPEAEALIQEGVDFVPDLISASQKSPLVVKFSPKRAWVVTALEEAGIRLSERSSSVLAQDLTKLCYQGGDYDILTWGFSVVSGDPDGIYHALGKNGAILNPTTYRKPVGDLLEEGRKIIGQEKLDAHYRKVSEAVLREVPFVHLGFGRAVAVFQKDRVVLGDRSLRRNEGHLNFFQLKR